MSVYMQVVPMMSEDELNELQTALDWFTVNQVTVREAGEEHAFKPVRIALGDVLSKALQLEASRSAMRGWETTIGVGSKQVVADLVGASLVLLDPDYYIRYSTQGGVYYGNFFCPNSADVVTYLEQIGRLPALDPAKRLLLIQCFAAVNRLSDTSYDLPNWSELFGME
jgi:hypothetical protein